MLSVAILSVVMLSIVLQSVVMLRAFMLSVAMLSVVMLSIVMLSVFMLNVVILNVVILSVIMLCVAAPLCTPKFTFFAENFILQRFQIFASNSIDQIWAKFPTLAASTYVIKIKSTLL